MQIKIKIKLRKTIIQMLEALKDCEQMVVTINSTNINEIKKKIMLMIQIGKSIYRKSIS